MRRVALSLLAALLALGIAGPARASSIVFVRDGDVWLTTPDHAREHRVTTGGAFTEVTQADDGTIVAGKGTELHRMDRLGHALSAPFSVRARYGGGNVVPAGIELSPDGTKVAYWTLTQCYSSVGPTLLPCDQVEITDSDHGTDPDNPYAYVTGNAPAWLAGDRLFYASNACLYTTGLAMGTGADWFCDGDRTADDDIYLARQMAITPSHDKLVVKRRPYRGGPWSLRFYSLDAEPPAQPTPRCTRDFGDVEPSHPSWSPDGGAIAWEQADGIHVTPAPDLGTCTASGGFTIPGAHSPDWGPADVPAAAPPACCSPPPKATQTLATVRANGLKVAVSCPKRCRIAVTASVDRATSRRLRIARKAVTVGKARAALRRAGTTVVTVKLTRAARNGLRHASEVVFRLAIERTYGKRPAKRSATRLRVSR